MLLLFFEKKCFIITLLVLFLLFEFIKQMSKNNIPHIKPGKKLLYNNSPRLLLFRSLCTMYVAIDVPLPVATIRGDVRWSVQLSGLTNHESRRMRRAKTQRTFTAANYHILNLSYFFALCGFVDVGSINYTKLDK